MTRREFQKLAEVRVSDVEALMTQGRHSAAYYLAGYAVECALKACIAKQTRRHDFPPKKAADLYIHSIPNLVKLSGLKQSFDQDRQLNQRLNINWTVVENWSEISRYEAHGQKEAAGLHSAVSDSADGVLACIKRYW